ncbi:MAG: response regulator [Propionivibrio sp.]
MEPSETVVRAAHCRGELLIVDDSAASLAYLSSLLTQAGFHVREAPSGELALMTLAVRIPELILLDVRMPGIDGFEVCRRIKASPMLQDIPVVFLSAQDELTDKAQGLQVGAVDFVGKSSSADEMLARIDTHIALARTKQALEQERSLLEDRVRERTAELFQERSLLRAVIDSGPDWIYAVDREHRFLLVNRSMASALGHATPTELTGQRDCDVFPSCSCTAHGSDPACPWHEGDSAVFGGNTLYRAVGRLPVGGGRDICFETFKTPLHDADNTIYGLLSYRRDISRRLKMEDENLNLERALWQAKKMEAVGQLAGGIAHDFNHLLSLILGYAQFAETAMANGRPEKLASYIAEIMKAGTEGQAVVAQLLAFSRIEEIPDVAVDIGPTVSEAVDFLRQAVQPAVKLSLAIETPLPPVFVKPAQVRQIVTNFVLNARDAVAGKTEGAIEIRLSRVTVPQPESCMSCRKPYEGDFLTLSVRDNGEGIAPENLERLFEPFFTTKDIGKGTGLGLPMVHGIIHSAGGHIQVRSAPESGTSFAVYLPIPSASS